MFKTAAELESRALSIATNGLASDINKFNKLKAKVNLNDLLNINSQNKSKRQAFDKPPLSLSETCYIVSLNLMKDEGSSVKLNQYVDKFSRIIGKVGDDYSKELEEKIVVIDSKKYISNEKFKLEEDIGRILDKADKMQKTIDSDDKLNDKERKALEIYIQTVQTNIVNIDRFFPKCIN